MSDVNGLSNNEEETATQVASEEPQSSQPSDGPIAETATREGIPETAEDELETAKAEAEKNWNLYLRAVAETENVRKRAGRDLEHAHKFGLERFSNELLAVIDSMEMGLQAAESADAAALREGMATTLKLLAKTLNKFNIVEIDPEGEPFDPEFHEAISMQESDTAEPNTVIQVVQKGYTLNARLLRAARVIVSRAPEKSDGSQ